VRTSPDWRRRYIHLAMRRHKSIAGTFPVIRVFGCLATVLGSY
jgi:hypothetical protein